MSAQYHALAAASAIIRRNAPKGCRAWSRSLPSLEVSLQGSDAISLVRVDESLAR